jgi:hypothetical protein
MIEFVNGRNVNGVMCCGDFATAAALLQLQVFQLQLQVSAAWLIQPGQLSEERLKARRPPPPRPLKSPLLPAPHLISPAVVANPFQR